MGRRWFHLCLQLVLLLAVALLLVAAEDPYPKRTLARKADPVEIPGKELPALLGSGLEEIRLVALQHGEWIPIPVQIDERKEVLAGSGEHLIDYVFPYGPLSEKDGDPTFDSNDLAVFLAKDLGDRGQPADLPLKGNALEEIEITDPTDGSRGWAYMFRGGPEAEASGKDYVKYSDSERSVEATGYRVEFSRESPLFFQSIYIGGAMDACQRNMQDILGPLQLGIQGAVFFHSLHFEKTGSDFRSRVQAWIDGPIRVIRRTENKVYLIWGLYSPSKIQDTTYYPDHFFTPIHLVSPMELGRLITYGEIRASAGLEPPAAGTLFFSTQNQDGCIMDGVFSEQERRIWTAGQDWYSTSGICGTLFNRLILKRQLPIEVALYYRDDLLSPDPPEGGIHRIGDAGYRLTDLVALDKGDYDLVFHTFISVPYHRGDENAFLDVVDRPLEWRSRVLENPAPN